MEANHILEMLATNREYLRRRHNIALENLSMLHGSFDGLGDEGVTISLALNDAIAAMVFRADYSYAISISQGILDRFSHSPYVYLIASHEMLIGRCHTFAMRFDQAWEHMLRAETLAFDVLPAVDENLTLRADILHEMAMATAQSGGDKDEAVRCLEKALRIIGDTGYHRRRAVFIIGIGNVRFSQYRYEDAQNYYMRAEAILEESDDYYNHATVLCNLGVCHTCLNMYGMAEDYLLRSLEIRNKWCSYGDIAGSYYNLAALYERRGEAERAYKTMLASRDYAFLSQIRAIQIRTIRELEAMALAIGDVAASKAHAEERSKIEQQITA